MTKNKDVRKAVCDIISKMLDNPDKNGIYPTGKCYDEFLRILHYF